MPKGVCLVRPGSFLFEVSAKILWPYDSCPRSLLPLNACLSVCAFSAHPSSVWIRVRPVSCTARYSNAGRCDTSGAMFAGGHQISFAQANHHRSAGPLVSLQVGFPFCHLSAWCVATSAATTSAAVQHTIWSYVYYLSWPCLHTSQPRSLLPMAEQVNTAWYLRHQSALGGSGLCSEVRTLMLDYNQKVLVHPQATMLSCTHTIQLMPWARLER